MVAVVVMNAGDQKVSYLLWLDGSAAEVSSDGHAVERLTCRRSKLRVTPEDALLRVQPNRTRTRPVFMLHLLDTSLFKMKQIDIVKEQLLRAEGKAGRVESIEANDTTSLPCNVYLRLKYWEPSSRLAR